MKLQRNQILTGLTIYKIYGEKIIFTPMEYAAEFFKGEYPDEEN